MKNKFQIRPILFYPLFIIAVIQVTSCKKEPANRPPIANAGADQTITLPNYVQLDGIGSSDPDKNISSYVWTKIAGPSFFNINNASAMRTAVTEVVKGAYQFEITVTDAGGLFSKDTVQVVVNDAIPFRHIVNLLFGLMKVQYASVLVIQLALL